MRRWLVGVFAVPLMRSAPAAACQIETPFTAGCHEAITTAALRVAGWPDGATPPRATGELARAILDLTFRLPDGGDDAWTAALLVGERSNDLALEWAP